MAKYVGFLKYGEGKFLSVWAYVYSGVFFQVYILDGLVPSC